MLGSNNPNSAKLISQLRVDRRREQHEARVQAALEKDRILCHFQLLFREASEGDEAD